MPVNTYFDNYTNAAEQLLIEDLVVESIKMYALDCEYLPRTAGAVDDLLNEDDLPTFESYHTIEMYIKNVEGFDGEGDFLSKFGLQIRDSMTLTISYRSYNDIILPATGVSRPNEGDLVYFPMNNKIFKIMHVEHESVFYQIGALQTYDLKVELFEYSQERFTTGLPAVDDLFANHEWTSNTAIDDIDSFDDIADNTLIQSESDDILEFDPQDPFAPNQW